MKGMSIAVCCFLMLVALAKISDAQTGAPVADDLAGVRQQFQSELRELRLELIAQGLEFQEWKIRQLERDIERIEAEQRLLEEEEQSIRQQLAAVTAAVDPAAPAVEPRPPGEDARSVSDDEVTRADLSGPRLKRVRARRQPLADQEAELRKQLAQEQRKREELVKKLKQLQPGGAPRPEK